MRYDCDIVVAIKWSSPQRVCSSHLLRRESATEMARSGFPLMDVMIFGRWASLSSFKFYIAKRGRYFDPVAPGLLRCPVGCGGAVGVAGLGGASRLLVCLPLGGRWPSWTVLRTSGFALLSRFPSCTAISK